MIAHYVFKLLRRKYSSLQGNNVVRNHFSTFSSHTLVKKDEDLMRRAVGAREEYIKSTTAAAYIQR